jgi:hypothetical protein
MMKNICDRNHLLKLPLIFILSVLALHANPVEKRKRICGLLIKDTVSMRYLTLVPPTVDFDRSSLAETCNIIQNSINNANLEALGGKVTVVSNADNSLLFTLKAANISILQILVELADQNSLLITVDGLSILVSPGIDDRRR